MRVWWTSVVILACAMAGPAFAAPDGPPVPDIRVTRAPVLGSAALDPLFHDPSVYAPDPLPIETGAALVDLVLGQIPQAVLVGPSGAARGVLDRVERGGVGRLARRIGGDEIVLPLWTLHFPGRR